MPANVQTLGNIQTPSDGLASVGGDVFTKYGVVQSIGANGGVTLLPPKYYREYEDDVGNKSWVEVTDQDDLQLP